MLLSSTARQFTISRMGMSEFGKLIRETREMRAIDLSDLAHDLGIATSTLSKLETGGQAKTPAPEFLKKLRCQLGLSIPEMLSAIGYDLGEGDDQRADPSDPKEVFIRAVRAKHLDPVVLRVLTNAIRDQPPAHTQKDPAVTARSPQESRSTRTG